MGEKQPYPTSAQLDAIVLRMYRAGIVYSEAVREFKKKLTLSRTSIGTRPKPLQRY
jgi:hypothetical protein